MLSGRPMVRFPLLLALALLLAACGASPREVVAGFELAVSRGDAAAAGALLADDAMVATDDVRLADRRLVDTWIAALVAAPAHLERAAAPTTDGDTIRWTLMLRLPEWVALGLAGVEHDAEATVAGGRITALHLHMSPNGRAALAHAALERNARTMQAASDAVGSYSTAALMPLLADDAIFEVMGSPPLRGKPEVSTWLASLGAQEAAVVLARELRALHGVPLWLGEMGTREWRAMGLEALPITTSATFTPNGKIQTLRLTLTETAAARLAASAPEELTAEVHSRSFALPSPMFEEGASSVAD